MSRKAAGLAGLEVGRGPGTRYLACWPRTCQRDRKFWIDPKDNSVMIEKRALA